MSLTVLCMSACVLTDVLLYVFITKSLSKILYFPVLHTITFKISCSKSANVDYGNMLS